MGRVDPLELLGIIPDAPMAFWGRGSLPDQYGRRWDGDDGESPPPTRPAEPPQSPDPSAAAPPVDLTEFRRAVMAGKVNDVIEALAGVSIVTALQQGTGLVRTYRAAKPAGRRSMVPIILSVLQRLQGRGWAGDALLADEMLAVIRDEEFPGEVVAVDLGQLSFTMSDREGGYLNRRTGETLPASATDPMVIGEEYAVDPEDPDWLHLVDDNRESWRDMEDFAESVADPFIRQSLAAAVQARVRSPGSGVRCMRSIWDVSGTASRTTAAGGGLVTSSPTMVFARVEGAPLRGRWVDVRLVLGLDDAGNVGHDRLPETLAEFASRWQTGVEELIHRQDAIADRLASVAGSRGGDPQLSRNAMPADRADHLRLAHDHQLVRRARHPDVELLAGPVRVRGGVDAEHDGSPFETLAPERARRTRPRCPRTTSSSPPAPASPAARPARGAVSPW